MVASNRNYREIELNGAARAYLHDMLNDGLSLGKALISNWPITSCKVVTKLPKTASEQRATRFDLGGVAEAQVTLNWLCDVVKRAMARQKCLVILQNFNARRGDRWIVGVGYHLLYHGDEVLHRADSDYEFDRDRFVAELKGAHTSVWLTGIIVPVAHPGTMLLNDGMEISDDVLRVLARDARAVFVAAYDGEGYLVATKNSFDG